jgi:hypothetical protein
VRKATARVSPKYEYRPWSLNPARIVRLGPKYGNRPWSLNPARIVRLGPKHGNRPWSLNPARIVRVGPKYGNRPWSLNPARHPWRAFGPFGAEPTDTLHVTREIARVIADPLQ